MSSLQEKIANLKLIADLDLADVRISVDVMKKALNKNEHSRLDLFFAKWKNKRYRHLLCEIQCEIANNEEEETENLVE